MIRSDRLSDLPDHLLQQILSFLPTQEAIATSLLSKRWTSLWTGSPTLHFDALNFRSSIFFVEFVEHALIFFRNSNHVQIFRLRFGSSGIQPDDNIVNWVTTVINKLKVEELDLCFTSYWFSVDLSSEILNSSAMRVLKLNGVTVSTDYSVNLPSLEVLHLERVIFPEFRCLVMLLTGCPRLEELKLNLFVIFAITKATKIESLQHLVSSKPSFLVRLKRFCFDQFKASETQYRVARFIMDNAKALNTVSIICRSSVNSLPNNAKKVIHMP
ncbi:F-box/FBD/LRR-repeat protein At5g22700-like [Neltuma alba]|uniref:F-box/FBD/LRR-repeat protein At5g22700-like n=1 Tax=Neltuma alba TaxID=207710 RepID=UPI0010A3CD84|nr:F-box/FBD/LRR-repeat protein At5g22700-like [Prosopis alba]XP_028806322.1 F-box/FBD/LRR-repeat protein At5g22700-like [Prosopis alba]